MGDRLLDTDEPRSRKPIAAFGFAACVLAAAVIAGFVGWMTAAKGNRQPVMVTGPSMSPTLWGPHSLLTCTHCGWSGKIHRQQPLTRSLPCFRCGRRDRTQSGPVLPGTQILIDRNAYWFRKPQTGDLVAIEKPQGGYQVKRVIGTPGDLVQINASGRILLNGQSYEPTLASPQPNTSWGIEVYQHSVNRPAPPDASRLTQNVSHPWNYIYEHHNIHNNGLPDIVRDDDPANVTLRRQMRAVDRLALKLKIVCQTVGRVEVLAEFDNRQLLWTSPLRTGTQWVNFDLDAQQVAGGKAIKFDGPPPPELSPPELSPTKPLAIRFVGTGETQLLAFELGRTVRYDPPEAFAELWSQGVRAQPKHYLVFGDNAPASEDSRQAPSGVPANRIIGRVQLSEPSHPQIVE